MDEQEVRMPLSHNDLHRAEVHTKWWSAIVQASLIESLDQRALNLAINFTLEDFSSVYFSLCEPLSPAPLVRF
jgi:hypothetical protein